MVYCTKCGTLNADDASVCANCGEPLHGTTAQSRPYERRWQWEEYRKYHRRIGAFAALAIGLIIILIGFSALLAEVYGVIIPWGAIILIFIGALIIVAGIRTRRRWQGRT